MFEVRTEVAAFTSLFANFLVVRNLTSVHTPKIELPCHVLESSDPQAVESPTTFVHANIVKSLGLI